MSRKREEYEDQIEVLIEPIAEQVRNGACIVLGRLRDLYPSPQDDRQPARRENYVWSIALGDVTARHGITVATGSVYTRSEDDSSPADFSTDLHLFLVPQDFHGPVEAEEQTPAGRHYALGRGFWWNDCLEEAVEELQEAIRLEPDRAEAHELLARVLLDRGQVEAGVASYREAIRLDPTDEGKYNELGMELQFKAGRLADAIEGYREGVRAVPDSAWLHFRLALALSDAGRDEEAMAEYHEAIRLDPGEYGYHLNLAHLLRDAGRLDEAVAECREAVRLLPTESDVVELLHELLGQLEPGNIVPQKCSQGESMASG